MSGALIVSGTDTGIGKTVVAAGLAAALGASYWKPIQAGTADGTDSSDAVTLGVAPGQCLPEAYRLALPASPHLAAEREGLVLDPSRLTLPPARPLIVEGAGGLMVPVRRDPSMLMIDLFAGWGAPVLLVARTGLGTINHSLLSIEALKARSIAIAGLIFVGEVHPDNEAIVPALTGVRSFGRLPMLDPLDAAHLRQAMHAHIDLAAVRMALGGPS
ncbi:MULTISPECIES: dethiobiotin synthase [Sphingobium]|uniref:dethiobiotin synthase n=1 Tax=Sphingobium TaxID=165695 RepID=UPI0015ECB7C9|nr:MULTISPECIES: dethiobiotin synthase [Sphingobium]MCW2349235.1 dethiobiotin synthetase [Sphingobium sp. B12D2B]MCW2363070.1 dethiobiotin synthetase [Sphingobium sp. B10D3B]MCW2396581.1 dethiobiotin synthetase [Sphingobium sp. B8D3B]MCW2400250.1 dethiobiotin synthetase [Sphingobium sp. B10D7B]MCW2407228.1 dethiobiotin synthetase [Sphingobium xanthum]